MPNLAIHAEGLAKQYTLGIREPYTTLRESVARAFRRLGRRPAPDRTFWALNDVSFDVNHGEVVGVIGRNGAGKSTLLKVLSRITAPTRGFADIHGRIGSLLEVGTGFHPELSGAENVYLSGAILGMSRREIARKFDEIVAFAEVERFLQTPVKHYSSGMYLRLAFAVAAHLEPEILVIDEVLAVGDLRFQAKCLDRMKAVSDTGRTVLFVSHSMGAIHRLCSRCILLQEGRVIADGPTDDVVREYVSQGLAGAPEFRQASDASKDVNLLRIALIGPDGAPTTDFRWSDPIRMLVEYEVHQPVDECTVWVGMYTAEGASLFSTSDTDASPELMGARALGHYVTTVELPARWLNAGRYQVVGGIARLGARVTYDRVEVCSINVLDVGTADRRPGILHPHLHWQTRSNDFPVLL